MHILKLTPMGSSLGVILPAEVLERLKLKEGESVFLTETPDGCVMTPHRPELDKQLLAGREFLCEYRDSFQKLAK